MGVLLGLLWPFRRLNDHLLPAGMALGVAAVAVMVTAILVQVFFRYVLGNALAWPEEAARFLMLWMTGLMAPTAFRRGGFVSIEMVMRLLPRPARRAAVAVLLLFRWRILVVARCASAGRGLTGIGGRFATSSLKIPTGLDFSTWMKVPRAWMMMSFHVGVTLLLSWSTLN